MKDNHIYFLDNLGLLENIEINTWTTELSFKGIIETDTSSLEYINWANKNRVLNTKENIENINQKVLEVYPQAELREISIFVKENIIKNLKYTINERNQFGQKIKEQNTEPYQITQNKENIIKKYNERNT